MRTVATVQVRMGSSRLPGKTLMSVAGKPLLGHLLDRLAQCELLDEVVVATTTSPTDDAVETYCRSRGATCFRGSEDDVLGRMLGALQATQATVGVEVFGDCPLIDPAIVDMMIRIYRDANGTLDFVGNDLKTTYPPGMEVEVFSVSAFEDSSRRTNDPAVREHGTLFVRQHPEIYRLRSIEAPPHHHRPDLELEVDDPADVQVITAVLEHFAPRLDFTLDEIIAFMNANPKLRLANASVPRRWKAMREDDA